MSPRPFDYLRGPRSPFGPVVPETTPEDHARALEALPEATRALVLDALRVRAMDCTATALKDNGARATDSLADQAADVYRAVIENADADEPFNPAKYPEPYYPDAFAALRREPAPTIPAPIDSEA